MSFIFLILFQINICEYGRRDNMLLRNISTIVGGIVGTIIGMCVIVDWVKRLKMKKVKTEKLYF